LEFDNLVDQIKIEKAILEILKAIGEDPNREGLADTPARVARFWEEFISWDCGVLDTAFEEVHVDEMIVMRNIKGFSICEHHLLPFSFTAHVGYLPLKKGLFHRFVPTKVLGASKIVRVVEKHAHCLQIQERMTYNIAQEIKRLTKAMGVGVIIEGRHLCIGMRGVQSPEAELVTSTLLGAFRKIEVRDEFLRLCGR